MSGFNYRLCCWKDFYHLLPFASSTCIFKILRCNEQDTSSRELCQIWARRSQNKQLRTRLQRCSSRCRRFMWWPRAFSRELSKAFCNLSGCYCLSCAVHSVSVCVHIRGGWGLRRRGTVSGNGIGCGSSQAIDNRLVEVPGQETIDDCVQKSEAGGNWLATNGCEGWNWLLVVCSQRHEEGAAQHRGRLLHCHGKKDIIEAVMKQHT